jgi:hypothetical protein
MFMGAFEGTTCPFFDEATTYLLKHNPKVNKIMEAHEKNVREWIVDRLNLS